MRLYFARTLKWTIGTVYVAAWIVALFNYKERCITTTLDDFTVQAPFKTQWSATKCWIDINDLSYVNIDINENVDLKQVAVENKEVEHGGVWAPTDCQPWQKVAVIVPYRDRLFHLKLLLKRLHPLLRKQRISYRVFVAEQDGKEQYNKGRLNNIAFIEALKTDHYDCFIFHDVDLLPESDRNIYLCDGQARHLSSAIDEMRYHLMFNNNLGGVFAVNRETFRRVNGFSNIYWGWGNEDDDLSARTLAHNILITRPPRHIGRYKMVRHVKSTRSEHGYELFMQFRGRMATDGLNQLENGNIKYEIVSRTDEPLYTHVLVDMGKPPLEPPIDPNGTRESWLWFLWFYFP